MPPIRVFITYAWESEELKAAVWELAGWLFNYSKGEIQPITDNNYVNRPPKLGWYIWMQDQIEYADIVLLVCTPKYFERFAKRDTDMSSGFGATFEGAIVTEELYRSKGINEKFFPILPEGGSHNNVPILLRAYDNGHYFPKDNIKIYKLIINDNPQHSLGTVDTAIVDNKLEEEKEIVNEVVEIVLHTQEKNTFMSPIQVLVRAYLSLNDLDKESVCKKVDINYPDFQLSDPFDRDKSIIKEVAEKNLLSSFWESINEIKAFENPVNPFNL
jgi:hypothetical protein